MTSDATPIRRRFDTKALVITILALFLLPIALRAAVHATSDAPRSWRDADWSSVGHLPAAIDHPEARVLVLAGRTGGWKGVFSVHTWLVVKPQGAATWRRYDVVGWGVPLRRDAWAPDGRWYGDQPRVVADIVGESAASAIPKIDAAIAAYVYAKAGDYRIWPGPNSNTFVASVLRAVPDLAVVLPPNAVGRDFRARFYIGPTDSRTGIEANMFGIVGLKLGLVEGIEINLLGLVVGLDARHPAVKLPGFGRIGLTAPRQGGSSA